MALKNMKLLLIISLLLRSEADSSYSHRPMDLMADLTNDLGMCILQIQSALQHGNTAFSPYGVASMSVLLFEGATGNTAIEIMKVLNLPWNTLLVRIGFRDINRHLKTYFRSDGFLRGLIMSRDDVCFHPSYQKMLRVYGFEEPDKALTYPCNGFTPYATTTTTVSSTSEEEVTVTSPSSNETTTGPTTTVESSTPTAPQTEETENVVTEMTQTSQTVMIVNSTTFTPIEAEAVNEAITSIKTELPSTLVGGTETTALGTITIPDTHMAISSGQTTLFSNTDEITKGITASLSTEPAVLLTAANTIMENKFSTTPRKNTALKTERTTPSSVTATTSKMQQLQNSTNISKKNVTTASGMRNQTNNFQGQAPKNGTKDELPNFNLTNLDVKNFTIKLETDFGFPTTDSSSIFDNFFNTTNELNIGSNGSLLGNISGSILPTTSSFSNFSTLFSGAKPTLDKELDLKNATSFYSTLVNFIENTTEKIKNLLGSKDGNLTTSNPQNVTKVSNVSTTLQNGNSSPKPTQNSTARDDKMMKNNSTATLLSAEKNSINADRGTVETNDTRNLPKKSISENNQIPKSAAISISPSAFRRAPNYYNIVSLKQSKSISSTYDIKGIKKSKRHRMKRDAQTKDGDQLNTKQTQESKLKDTQTEGNGLPNKQWPQKKAPIMNIWHFDDNNKTVIETKFHHYTANEKGRNDFYGSLKAGNNYNSDYRNNYSPEYRKAPSLNHRYFLPPGTDWFSTHGQNIRIPVFSYSAILPFAYIEDLKSKVLEIPLDDQNYQLLILLPSPDYGIEYLINSLTGYSLRKIRAHLRDTAVFASIPKFSVISHVNLRQALYYLGIRDVFHRYRADLSIMSPDARLFVKSIEQVITIHVDKFPNTAYPVPEPLTDRYFLASHPFLYFVIDKESGVNLVAGIMNDPLKQTIRFL